MTKIVMFTKVLFVQNKQSRSTQDEQLYAKFGFFCSGSKTMKLTPSFSQHPFKNVLLALACGFMLLQMPTKCCGQSKDAPTANGLLRGALLARSEIKTLRLKLEVESSTEKITSKTQYNVEMLDGKLRFEKPGHLSVFDGTKRLTFTRENNEDLIIRAEEDAARSTSARIFDPRILGLSDICPAGLQLQEVFWLGEDVKSHVAGEENLQGVRVWNVVAVRGDSTEEYWIDDSRFRVYRNRSSGKSYEIDIVSTFADEKSLIPTQVIARRSEPSSKTEIKFTVSSLDYGPVSPDRFEMKTFELPINTPAVDYALSKRIGFWDGEKLVPNLVTTEKIADVKPTERTRVWWLVSGALAALIIMAILIKRQSR